MGLVKRTKREVNQASSAKGSTAEDMVLIPVMRMEKPNKMVPMPFFFSDLQNMYKIMPIRAKMGLKLVGLSI